jgi:hypothetical protein
MSPDGAPFPRRRVHLRYDGSKGAVHRAELGACADTFLLYIYRSPFLRKSERLIADLTRAALAQKKAQGTILGNRTNLRDAQAKGQRTYHQASGKMQKMTAGDPFGNCFRFSFSALSTVFSENSDAVRAVTSTLMVSTPRTALKSKSSPFCWISGVAKISKPLSKNILAEKASKNPDLMSRFKRRHISKKLTVDRKLNNISPTSKRRQENS